MEDHHDFSGYSIVAIKYTSFEVLRYNSKINQHFASTFSSNYVVALSRFSFYEVKLCSVCSFWEISGHNQGSYSSYVLKLLVWDEWAWTMMMMDLSRSSYCNLMKKLLWVPAGQKLEAGEIINPSFLCMLAVSLVTHFLSCLWKLLLSRKNLCWFSNADWNQDQKTISFLVRKKLSHECKLVGNWAFHSYLIHCMVSLTHAKVLLAGLENTLEAQVTARKRIIQESL